MSKFTIFFIFCMLILSLVECQSWEKDEEAPKIDHRVTRQVDLGLNVASQVASTAVQTAKKALRVGAQVLKGMASGASQILQ